MRGQSGLVLQTVDLQPVPMFGQVSKWWLGSESAQEACVSDQHTNKVAWTGQHGRWVQAQCGMTWSALRCQQVELGLGMGTENLWESVM